VVECMFISATVDLVCTELVLRGIRVGYNVRENLTWLFYDEYGTILRAVVERRPIRESDPTVYRSLKHRLM